MCQVLWRNHPTSLNGLITNGGKKDDSKVHKGPWVTENKDQLICSSTSLGSMVVSICIVPVQYCHPNKKKVTKTRYLLGSFSQCTFVTEQLLNKKGVLGEYMSLSIKIMNVVASCKLSVVKGFELWNSN